MSTKERNKKLSDFFASRLEDTSIDSIRKWLKKPENRAQFKNYIKALYAINRVTTTYDIDAVKKSFFDTIEKEAQTTKPTISLYTRMMRYAAVAIVVVGTSFFLWNYVNNNPLNSTTDNSVVAGTNKALLDLGDGEQLYLNGTRKMIDGAGEAQDGFLAYNFQKANSKEKGGYNTITIPRGGQYKLQLSDGTLVTLNSDSKLRYPAVFEKGKLRNVELVYGEAFFDVTSSDKVDGAPFIVKTKRQSIKVLGTSFNVKSYKEEDKVYTTLVEGAVAIATPNGNRELRPNEQAVFVQETGLVTIDAIKVKSEISWKNGKFSFRDKPLAEIMTVLSRWYDVTIVYKNDALKTQKFNGVLGKNQKLEDILNVVQDFGIIKRYTIKNKKLMLE